MAKKSTVVLLLGIIITGLIAIGNGLLHPLACEGQPINNNVDPTPAQQIWGERVIGQSFIAPRNGLNRIDILFQTYGRQNTHDVILRLLEVPENIDNPFLGIERFKTTFNAASVSDQSWRTFTFPPLADSAGKRYLIALESPTSVEGDAITVGGIERNSYLPGTAFAGPVPVNADITFRSCYQMTTGEKLQVLAEQITRSRPGIWGNISFYGVILLLYGLLLIGFFWSLVKWML